MFTLIRSDEFIEWFRRIRDVRAAAKVAARLTSAEQGNFGDSEPVGDGISEMRIHYGPGYRVYYKRVGSIVYIILLGGDKSTQAKDIRHAKAIAERLEKETDR